MKTNKRNLVPTAVVMALLMLKTFSPALASDRVGNPNGDDAFALQKIADENPGLSQHEVLLKAFEESKGRPVELKWKEYSSTMKRACLLGKSPSGGIFFAALSDKNPNKVLKKQEGPCFFKTYLDRGPLLGGNSQHGDIQVQGEFFNRMGVWDEATSNATFWPELVVNTEGKYNATVSDNEGRDLRITDHGKAATIYRQYNSKIIVYAVSPFINDRGFKSCYYRTKKDLNKRGAYCYVGYLWVE
jgi:hypothetical protein